MQVLLNTAACPSDGRRQGNDVGGAAGTNAVATDEPTATSTTRYANNNIVDCLCFLIMFNLDCMQDELIQSIPIVAFCSKRSSSSRNVIGITSTKFFASRAILL